MTEIKDKDKVEIGQYFTEGIHQVRISGVMLQNVNDKEFLEVGVEGQGGETAEVRLYFTEKALKYSVNTIRQIFVHNMDSEIKKEAARKAVNNCKTTEELATLCDTLEGKECWYSKFKSGTQYQNAQGEMKDSYNNNLFGYEPKPPKNISVEQKVAATMGGGEITKDNLGEFPFPD